MGGWVGVHVTKRRERVILHCPSLVEWIGGPLNLSMIRVPPMTEMAELNRGTGMSVQRSS